MEISLFMTRNELLKIQGINNKFQFGKYKGKTLLYVLDNNTTESCCGHLKAPYRIFFVSDSFSAIGMLYRCVDKRYSDGNWKIEVCCSDINPTNGFLLTSVKIFETEDEIMRSVNNLINNITYWNGIQFKDYFKEIKSIDDFKIVKQDKNYD